MSIWWRLANALWTNARFTVYLDHELDHDHEPDHELDHGREPDC